MPVKLGSMGMVRDGSRAEQSKAEQSKREQLRILQTSIGGRWVPPREACGLWFGSLGKMRVALDVSSVYHHPSPPLPWREVPC